jgi:DNA-binding NarL/FixJ family response regulator
MGAQVVRVAVVEDDPDYRASLALLFENTPGFALAGAFPAAEAALAADPGGWDLVLMDLDLPGMDGTAATQRLRAVRPELPIVVLTVFEEPARVVGAICAGADGYLLKRSPHGELIQQLGVVLAGGAPLSGAVARTVLGALRATAPRATPAEPPADLSPREYQVLTGLVDGRAYKQIAGDLDVSIDTIRTYVRSLYKKLRVHSVSEAVAKALRHGLTA